MFSSAVSSIDHVGVGEPRSHARRAHLRMPDHQDIRVVTLERKYRILETLPFGHAGSRPLDVDHIRGQTLTRQLKGSKGPRGRLKEHVHLSSTAQCGNLSLIHISEPTRRTPISYAVFCLKKKKKTPYTTADASF